MRGALTDTDEAVGTLTTRVIDRIDIVAWLVIALVAMWMLERQNAPRTFFIDEWVFVFDRHRGGPSGWLAPTNGQLTVIPRIAYRILFATFGLDHYRPYRLMGLLCHVLLATLVYCYVRSRQGKIIGVTVGTLFLLLGSGWEVIFQPFAINFTTAAGFGIIAWLALDRRTARGDVVASLASALAVACGGFGVAFLIGTAARIGAGREWRRLGYVAGPAAVLYTVWFAAYGEPQGSLANIGRLPRYIVDEAASSVGGLAGRDLLWGRLSFGILVVVVVVVVRSRRELRPSALAPAVALAANWLIVGYSRADLHEPASSRYVYGGALLLLLFGADLMRIRASLNMRLAVATAVLIGVCGNWWVLHAGPVHMRIVTTYGRAELRAVEWSASTVDPYYAPDPLYLPGIGAGPYLDAVGELGSAAATDGEVAAQPEEIRREVDRVALEAGQLTAVVVATPQDCTVPLPDGIDTDLPASRYRIASGTAVTITTSGGPAEIRLRRYADGFADAPALVVPVDETELVTIPADTAPLQQWILDVRTTGGVRVCTAAG